MILAAGSVLSNADIIEGYNVTSCTWEEIELPKFDTTSRHYRIELTGIDLTQVQPIVLVTASYPHNANANGMLVGSSLTVSVWDGATGQETQGSFNFIVLDATP
jgi:hypothetical protein